MDTPWRLHLTQLAVIQLDIVHGKEPFLAAWAANGAVAYYTLADGKPLGKARFILPKATDYADESWKSFLPTLKGHKNATLPRIRTDAGQVWTADNGATAVVYTGGRTFTHLSADGKSKTFGYDVNPAALAVDPQTYTAVALDFNGVLLVAKPTSGVKTVELGFEPQIDLPLNVKIARGAGRIAASDGTRLIVTDGAGKILAKRELAYACSLIALSQDGARVLTYDSDSGVLRSYEADDLTMTHQRFVSDLMTTASTSQLIADPPHARAALSALTCDGEGHIAFAVAGHVCGAVLDHLKLKNMSTIVAPPLVEEAAAPSKPAKPAAASVSKPPRKPQPAPVAEVAKPAAAPKTSEKPIEPPISKPTAPKPITRPAEKPVLSPPSKPIGEKQAN